MNQLKKNIRTTESNLLELIVFKLLPYWPLLLFFIVISIAGALAYLKFALPSYEATATLLIKDEKKGSEDSRIIDDLNILTSKKIVENEIEVIRSRSLMKEVVRSLRLYAPISMEGEVRTVSAYTSTPVIIEVSDPDKIEEEIKKVYFTFDKNSNLVKIDNNNYPLNEWVKTSYGELKFLPNPRLKNPTTNRLFFSLYPPKRVMTSLVKSLNVNAPNKLSSIVNLQFIDEVPERAEDMLNELITAYNRAGINDKNALADNTLQFIDDRLKHVKVEVDSVEKQIQDFRAQRGAINLSEQSSMFLQNVGTNDQRAALIDMQLAVLDQVQNYVGSGKAKGTIVPSTLGIDDPILSQMLTRLSNTELEYEKLKNTTAENNPVLISLSDELKQLRPMIIEGIRVQRLNLQSSVDQIQQTNKKYSKILHAIPEKERELLEISRQRTTINNVYDFLLQKKEETALSYASTIPDSRVLDVAESSLKPISPRKVIALPAALFIAFILTFAVIYLKDFASNKILFRSEIDRLAEYPVVGEIAYLKKSMDPVAKNDFIKQQMFEIIASLGLFNSENSFKKILITSSTSGEGKSFISTSLATNLAEAGKKVVLVDLDFKKSTVSNSFRVAAGPGVAEVLKGQVEPYDVINSTSIDNVYLVSAGNMVSNYSALLSNNRIQHLLSFLEQSFDFIIIDTSPIDPVADSLILTQLGDITLYTARHSYTSKALFQFQIRKLVALGTSNVGIIFNGVKSRGFIKGFGFGYGNEYSYSYKKDISKKNFRINPKEIVKEVNN